MRLVTLLTSLVLVPYLSIIVYRPSWLGWVDQADRTQYIAGPIAITTW